MLLCRRQLVIVRCYSLSLNLIMLRNVHNVMPKTFQESRGSDQFLDNVFLGFMFEKFGLYKYLYGLQEDI
jgi:hypothetical protein